MANSVMIKSLDGEIAEIEVTTENEVPIGSGRFQRTITPISATIASVTMQIAKLLSSIENEEKEHISKIENLKKELETWRNVETALQK